MARRRFGREGGIRRFQVWREQKYRARSDGDQTDYDHQVLHHIASIDISRKPPATRVIQ